MREGKVFIGKLLVVRDLRNVFSVPLRLRFEQRGRLCGKCKQLFAGCGRERAAPKVQDLFVRVLHHWRRRLLLQLFGITEVPDLGFDPGDSGDHRVFFYLVDK